MVQPLRFNHSNTNVVQPCSRPKIAWLPNQEPSSHRFPNRFPKRFPNRLLVLAHPGLNPLRLGTASACRTCAAAVACVCLRQGGHATRASTKNDRYSYEDYDYVVLCWYMLIYVGLCWYMLVMNCNEPCLSRPRGLCYVGCELCLQSVVAGRISNIHMSLSTVRFTVPVGEIGCLWGSVAGIEVVWISRKSVIVAVIIQQF